MSEVFWKHPRSSEALVRQWTRKVSRWPSVPFLLEEVQRRMLSRAEIMRPPEGPLLLQGWAHSHTAESLRALFPARALNVLGPAPWPASVLPQWDGLTQPQQSGGVERAGQLFRRFLSRASAGVFSQSEGGLDASTCAVALNHPDSGGVLPLPDDSQAMVWSPLWLHQENRLPDLIGQWNRVLKPEGGVFFTCFGPDTARELQPFAQALGQTLPDFADMHDLGDLLARQGFSDPVMEMEKLTLTYTDPAKLIREWRELHGNLLDSRPKGLLTAAALARAYDALRAQARDGVYALTLELVYGHAWKVKRVKASGVATVALSEIGGRKAKPASGG